MKKIFSILMLTAFSVMSFAQVDRSKQPEPGPARAIDFGDYELFELKNGLKIIVVQDDKLPRVTMNLLIDRDPIFEGDKAGYVSLAGDMLRQGTESRPKDALDEEIDFMGASVGTSSSNIFGGGLSKYTEDIMRLMADMAMNPAFPEDEFEKIKKQQISGIESNKDDPGAVGSTVFSAVLYGKDHPYGEPMTVETVEAVTLDDCKAYYKKYWMPNAAYLAVVGDIKPKNAKKLAKKYFGKWEMGTKPENKYNAPATPTGKAISFVNKESAVQSVLNLGNIIDLKPGHPDIAKLQLTNQILGNGSLGRLFQNIREDKGYTYGAYSDYDWDEMVGSFTANASVRNEVTDSAITEFIYEFDRIRNESVTAEELQGAKNYVNGSFGRSLESPQTIANFALNIERYGLPKDYYQNYLKNLDAVTVEDIMATAKKYISTDNMHITVVGKASEVAALLEKFGKVTYYDEEGNVTTEPSLPLPEGITAEKVIDDYIKAIGGGNIDNIKDLQITMSAEIPGAPPITIVNAYKMPNQFKSEWTAQGMGTLQKTIYDGEKGKKSGMQGTSDVTGDELAELKVEAKLVPETYYSEAGYTLKLTKMAMVNGKKAYVMEVTSPSGSLSTEYYDSESGLKLRSEQVEVGPQGSAVVSTTFDSYQEVGGIKLPYDTSVLAGPQKIKLSVTDVAINKGIKDSEFQIN